MNKTSIAAQDRIVVGLPQERVEDMEQLFDTAAAIALQRGASITLVHAISRAPHLLPQVTDLTVEDDVRSAHTLLEAARRRLAAKVDCRTMINVVTSTQRPAAALVEQCEGASLLLLRHRTLSVPRRILTGSITDVVAGQASCPVMALHSNRVPTLGSVVVGVSPSGTSDAAVRLAFGEASWRAVSLVAVQAWDIPHGQMAYAWGHVPAEDLADFRSAAEVNVAKALAALITEYPDVPVERRVVRGPVAQNLLSCADKAQLMVVGRHRQALLTSFGLGQVARTLIAQAACPVIVAPVGSGSPASSAPQRDREPAQVLAELT